MTQPQPHPPASAFITPPLPPPPCTLRSSPAYLFRFLNCTTCSLGSWPSRVLFCVWSTLSPLGFLMHHSSSHPQLRRLFSEAFPAMLLLWAPFMSVSWPHSTPPSTNSYANYVLFQTNYSLACHIHCGIQREGWHAASSQSTSICWVNEWINEWLTPKPDKKSFGEYCRIRWLLSLKEMVT